MFWFFILLIPVLLSLWPAFAYFTGHGWGSTRSDANAGMVFFAVITILLFIAFVITNLASYSNQIRDGEELAKIGRFEEIYQNKADVLTQQFAMYLADIYPEYEKNIFESISPDGIDIYLVKYPELKASETIMLLVSEIKMLQNDYYDQQLSRAEVVRDMSYRKKSPWVVQWFMPDVEM